MLSVAIAGLGTVGAAAVKLLQANADIIAARIGQPITVKAVSARDKNRKRDCNLSNITWVDDPRKLAQMPDVDVVVELIGGADGIAREIAEATLKNGKHLVTANKALLAKHGVALAQQSDKAKTSIGYEAAVAGGIPAIKTLREGLGGNRITTVQGILNGTCNYILTRMSETGASFEAALAEAQQHGYAEADPSGDIDGHDSANKLAILAALAFGVEPDLASVQVDGIRLITPADLQFAKQLGCRIKLLGIARMSKDGLEQHVAPTLVPENSMLARVKGALNAVLMRGDFIGDLMLEGQGAGAHPTASAVVADIMDIARGSRIPVFGVPAGQLKKVPSVNLTHNARYYIRLSVMDKPGVVADISAILRDESISIESLLQSGKSATESVPVVITTHTANTLFMAKAVDKIAKLPTVVHKPCLLHIED
jgi:homoserine dehydrogenase